MTKLHWCSITSVQPRLPISADFESSCANQSDRIRNGARHTPLTFAQATWEGWGTGDDVSFTRPTFTYDAFAFLQNPCKLLAGELHQSEQNTTLRCLRHGSLVLHQISSEPIRGTCTRPAASDLYVAHQNQGSTLPHSNINNSYREYMRVP